MQNIDLPDYLKNSRFLNNLSVRQLLQHWTVVCVLAVTLLSLAALITNDISSRKQGILNEKLIPSANILRNLDLVLDEYGARKKQLLAATRPEELQPGQVPGTREQEINAYLSQLTDLTAGLDGLHTVVPGLQDKFMRFLAYDHQLVDCLSAITAKHAKDPDAAGRHCEVNQLSLIVMDLNSNLDELRASRKRASNLVAESIKSFAAISHDLSIINLAVVVTVSLVVIAVVIAGASLIVFRIDDPLHRLRAAMHDLSSGDMGIRMDVAGAIRDEFSDLAQDFNHFAARLQSLFQEVISAKNSLEESEKRTRAILENALVGIAHIKDGEFVAVNRKFEEIFGYAKNEISGLKKEVLYPSADDHREIVIAATTLLANGETYHGEWKMKHRNGTIFWCAVSAKSISADTGAEGVIWLYEDITQRKRNEDELLRLANYDTLTGLPNRSLFTDRLEQSIGRARRQNGLLGLLYVDLDRFKKINDSFGHTTGDELLKSVSGRLCECVRSSDAVCHLSGDEFTIIVVEMQDITVAGKVAEKVIRALDWAFSVGGQEINISPSIGISIFPADADDVETLLKNADSAMYHAKSRGRNNYQYYTQVMNAEARLLLDRENRLRRAVDADQFRLYYQPQVDTKTLQVTGYEALIRWQDTEEGLVSPDQFVPLLEDTGLIVVVGDWIIRRACQDIPRLLLENKDFKSVSINLSARQFNDNGIVERISSILQDTAVSPNHLVIEITETVMMTEAERSLEILAKINNLGLKVSLDDFGTGYSSLAYLKQFPIDVIKIDRSFVQDLHNNQSDAAICEAIITIAHQLGLKVVAEGVETEHQFKYMRDRGCHSIQGYYFGKPVPIDELMCTVARPA